MSADPCPTCGALPGETRRRLPPGFATLRDRDHWIDCPSPWHEANPPQLAPGKRRTKAPSPFPEIEEALRAQAGERVDRAVQVGVCIVHGLTRAQTAEKVGCGAGGVKTAIDDLREAAKRLGMNPEAVTG